MIICTYLTLEENDNAPELSLTELTRELSDLFADVAQYGNSYVIPEGVTVCCGTMTRDEALERITSAKNYDRLRELSESIIMNIDVVTTV